MSARASSAFAWNAAWNAVHEAWCATLLAALAMAHGLRVLRFCWDAPPAWIDHAMGSALIVQFSVLRALPGTLAVQSIAVPLLLVALLAGRRRVWRRERGRSSLRPRWSLRPAMASIVWSLLAIDGLFADMHPGVALLYPATMALLALAHGVERWPSAPPYTRWVVVGAGAAIGLASFLAQETPLDELGAAVWIAVALPAGLGAYARLRLREGIGVLLAIAILQQAFMARMSLDVTGDESARILLGKGNAYSFCEMPGEGRIFTVAPSCTTSQVEDCRDDVIEEYASDDLSHRRTYAVFDERFYGRMLHLACLEHSVVVAMAGTIRDGRAQEEHVFELDVRDGSVWHVPSTKSTGHRVVLDPRGRAVLIAKEHSYMVARHTLGPDGRLASGDVELWPVGRSLGLQTDTDAIQPDERVAYFGEWIGGRRVHAVDLDDGRVLHSYTLNDGGTHSLAVDEELGHLVVTSLWGITVVNLEDGRVLLRRRTELGPRRPLIDERRGRIYVPTTFGNHIWVFDRATFELLGKIVVRTGARNGLITADGRYLLTGGGREHAAWDLDALPFVAAGDGGAARHE